MLLLANKAGGEMLPAWAVCVSEDAKIEKICSGGKEET